MFLFCLQLGAPWWELSKFDEDETLSGSNRHPRARKQHSDEPEMIAMTTALCGKRGTNKSYYIKTAVNLILAN